MATDGRVVVRFLASALKPLGFGCRHEQQWLLVELRASLPKRCRVISSKSGISVIRTDPRYQAKLKGRRYAANYNNALKRFLEMIKRQWSERRFFPVEWG